MMNNSYQPIISTVMEENQNNKEKQRHQSRLEKENNRNRSIRTNETEKQQQQRLEQQKQRSKANRALKKAQKQATGILDGQEQNTDLQTVEIGFDSYDSTDTNHSIPNPSDALRCFVNGRNLTTSGRFSTVLCT